MRWILCSAALVLFLTTLEARPQAPASKCKTGPMDLVFIIDSSRSVRPFEFETMRKFMIDIIHSLDIGPNATRVGVVQYSSQVKNEFSLKSFFKRSEMEKAINDIVPLAQGTMTGLAIQYAMNFAFTVQEGARPLAKKIPRVALIVTDGRPQDRVTEVAAQARDAGIEIYAVGVQRADMNSLRAMASPPLDEHVFLVESFDLIQQFALQFQDKLCGVDMCTEMDHGCAHNCVSVPGSYYCECNPGFKLAEDGKSCARIDMCSEMDHGCDHTCVSVPGSYYCECNPGFRLAEDGKSCARIDMCTEMDHGCAHTCVSVPGSYYCECNRGYKLGADGKSCIPIDYCAGGQHGCEHLCVSTTGSYHCRCRAGYYLNQDKKTCTMIDYCSFGNHSCEHECVSVLNGYFCRCNEGYTLKDDGKTCQANDMCNVVDHGCEFQCVSTPGSYHCICPEGRHLQANGKTCDGCTTSHVDLVFVIDGSKSVRPQNFELVKQFVTKIVDSLDISPQGTRVGLVQYSSRVRTEFALNQFSSAKDIKNAVLNIEYMEKGTMTGLAIQHMVQQSFSEAAGARPLSRNVPRIGLVFTDGRSQDSISEWSKKAKEAGILMYAVGVGKAVEDELKEIASEPVLKHFYYTSDFSAINQIAEDLKLNVCPEEIKGHVDIKNPCDCENIVEFQASTMTLLQNLTTKLAQMTARLEALENQLVSKK